MFNSKESWLKHLSSISKTLRSEMPRSSADQHANSEDINATPVTNLSDSDSETSDSGDEDSKTMKCIEDLINKYSPQDDDISFADGIEIYKSPNTGKEHILSVKGVRAGYILVPVKILDSKSKNLFSEPTFVVCPLCKYVAYDLETCSHCWKKLPENLRKFWILRKFPDEGQTTTGAEKFPDEGTSIYMENLTEVRPSTKKEDAAILKPLSKMETLSSLQTILKTSAIKLIESRAENSVISEISSKMKPTTSLETVENLPLIDNLMEVDKESSIETSPLKKTAYRTKISVKSETAAKLLTLPKAETLSDSKRVKITPQRPSFSNAVGEKTETSTKLETSSGHMRLKSLSKSTPASQTEKIEIDAPQKPFLFKSGESSHQPRSSKETAYETESSSAPETSFETETLPEQEKVEFEILQKSCSSKADIVDDDSGIRNLEAAFCNLHFSSVPPSTQTVDECVPEVLDRITEINLEDADQETGCDPNDQSSSDCKICLKYLDSDSIYIRESDILTLDPEQWLNDAVIDFYLEYLFKETLRPEQKKLTHIFKVPFFTALPRIIKSTKRLSTTYWAKDVDIFCKSFLVIPINTGDHWVVVIVCYPVPSQDLTSDEGTIRIEKVSSQTENIHTDEECRTLTDTSKENLELSNTTITETSRKVPCICIFDSLHKTYTDTISSIRKCLEELWRLEKGTVKTFNEKTLPSFVMNCPQQCNDFDCGVYMLQNVESFFENPFQLGDPMPDLTKSWYPTEWCASEKRIFLQNLIKKLGQK